LNRKPGKLFKGLPLLFFIKILNISITLSVIYAITLQLIRFTTEYWLYFVPATSGHSFL